MKNLATILPYEPVRPRRSDELADVPATGDARPLLELQDVSVEIEMADRTIHAVDRVSWTAERGKITALVGESGCGKSVTALAVIGLLRANARVTGGRILFDGRDLSAFGWDDLRALRGRDIAMIFQEPMTSLNPVLTIGLQIMESMFVHLRITAAEARERAIELMRKIGIPEPERRFSQYPHQLSGGMRQRVMIAIALSCNPKLIIADEPTTALDVTIQAQILDLLADLARNLNIALVIITHNMGVVARYADHVNVMYAGRIVESGPAEEVFEVARHPYTALLLLAVPRLDHPRQARLATIAGMPPDLSSPPSGCRFASRCPLRTDVCDTDPPLKQIGPARSSACHRWSETVGPAVAGPAVARVEKATVADGSTVLAVKHLRKNFGALAAVDDVSFSVRNGATLGLVGESGCGKTTIGRVILGLETKTSGEILFENEEIADMSSNQLKLMRTKMQVVFQDPYSSLNPRMTIGQTIEEPLRIHRKVAGRRAAKDRVSELLNRVGLRPEMAERYPHQLSGGQRQRVGIARALAVEPTFLVCDEPVSALDISIQGQIITLLEDLQDELGLTCLFIAHDLAVVRHISDVVAVMYAGRIMEMADRDELYANPQHPYTLALLAAAPTPDPALERTRTSQGVRGELTRTAPTTCPFHTRCPRADRKCRERAPAFREVAAGHLAACFHI